MALQRQRLSVVNKEKYINEKKQSIAVIGPNPIQSTKFPQNPDPIQSNPIQSNPIHGWIQSMSNSGVDGS